MKLTVLSIAYPLAAVGPDACGGAEQVLAALDSALVDSNHRSLVIAREDSQVRGELIPIPTLAGPYDRDATVFVHSRCRLAIEKVLAGGDIDVVHMHGVDFHAYLPPPGVPVLATLHLPISWYPREIFQALRPATFLNCVSEAQKRDCPPTRHLRASIQNGVEIPVVRRSENPEYALVIGRICPEKGFHLALEAATRAEIPLRIAGQVFPYERHERYFREQVQPRLGAMHVFLGPVGREAKIKLYANARCLVIPSTVPETSSLVALEALACGTPVVAFRIGALPEIVTHGRTGFLVDDLDQMAEAMKRASEEIDPVDCRRVVRERFSVEHMTAQYLSLLSAIAARAENGASEPEPAFGAQARY